MELSSGDEACWNLMRRRGYFFPVFAMSLFSLGLGYLLAKTLGNDSVAYLVPDMNEAKWIANRTDSAIGYFRKEVLLNSAPKTAYWVASGANKFTLFVNNNLVGATTYKERPQSRIFDITKHLKKGRNLLAVQVASDRANQPPVFLSRVEVLRSNGTRETVNTDSSWRSSSLYDKQSGDGAEWNSLEFSGQHWGFSRLAIKPLKAPMEYTGPPERIYRKFPEARPVAFFNEHRASTTLSRDIFIEGDSIEKAWLGLAVEGQYSLFLNKELVISDVPKSDVMKLIDIYDYIKPGFNQISVNVQSDGDMPKMTFSMNVKSELGEHDFSSDGSWRMLNDDKKAVAGTQNVFVSGAPSNQVIMSEAEPSGGWSLKDTALIRHYLAYSLLTLLIYLLFVGLISFLFRHVFAKQHYLSENFGVGVIENAPALPFFTGAFLIALLLVVRLDSGVSVDSPFHIDIIMQLSLVVALSVILSLHEALQNEKRGTLASTNRKVE